MKALEDLTYDKRKDFISKHRLPSDELPIVSFHTEASSAPGVLATMSHIAHAELPWLPLPQFITQYDDSYSFSSTAKVPVVIPLSAAMAISALHLRLFQSNSNYLLVLLLNHIMKESEFLAVGCWYRPIVYHHLTRSHVLSSLYYYKNY